MGGKWEEIGGNRGASGRGRGRGGPGCLSSTRPSVGVSQMSTNAPTFPCFPQFSTKTSGARGHLQRTFCAFQRPFNRKTALSGLSRRSPAKRGRLPRRSLTTKRRQPTSARQHSPQSHIFFFFPPLWSLWSGGDGPFGGGGGGPPLLLRCTAIRIPPLPERLLDGKPLHGPRAAALHNAPEQLPPPYPPLPPPLHPPPTPPPLPPPP